MSWDAVAWARSTGIEAGTPNTVPPPPPMPDGGVIAIEREAWLARVQPTAAIGTVELELRAAGWTLGPLPEDSERLPVVSAIATDQSSLAGSGAGFTTRRYDESSQGLRLRIRPMPAAQAAGLDALRRDMATRKEAGVPPRVEILGLPGGWQNASMVFGLQDTLGYNPLRISAYGRAVGPGENAVDPNSRKFPGTFRGYTCTLARLLGLEYLVLDRPLARLPRHVPRPRVTPVHSADGMYVYRLRDPAARAYLATTIRPVASDDAIAASDIPEFDMAREALIDEASMSLVGGAYAQGAGETASSRVNITRYGLNRVEIDVESDRAGVLVLHDLYYPGWTVKVDGETRPVLRANLLFRGVEVGAGRHSIVFEFAPLTLANLAAAARTALHAGEE